MQEVQASLSMGQGSLIMALAFLAQHEGGEPAGWEG